MKGWKKVLVGAVAAATVGSGAIGALAGTSEDRPARVEVKDRAHEAERGDIRREDRRADRREPEARGREAEGEAPRGMDDREDVLEAEDRGREAEGERGDQHEGRGMDDRSGPSENAGPSDDSGHHGGDD